MPIYEKKVYNLAKEMLIWLSLEPIYPKQNKNSSTYEDNIPDGWLCLCCGNKFGY